MLIDDKTWQTIGYISSICTIAGLSIGGIWIATYRAAKKMVRGLFENEITNFIKKEITDTLPIITERLIKDAQNHLLIMSQVLSLHYLKEYDAVLSLIGWDGNLEKIRTFNIKVRHCIIESLYNSRSNRAQNRESAWAALEDLYNEGMRDNDTIYLILDIGISSKRYKETYEKIHNLLETQLVPSILVLGSTLYRKLNDPIKAEEIARRAHALKPSMDTALALAVLLRDQGRFDHAHDALKPECLNIKSMYNNQRIMPKGWQRILNTYIANSIDMNDLGTCAEEAELLVKNITSPVETSTIGRYLINYKKSPIFVESTYSRLFENFSAAVSQSYECEAKVRCAAILQQLNGDFVNAKNTISNYLSSPSNKLRDIERSYLQCYLAALHLELGEIDDAIDTLQDINDHTLVAGEAEYILAKCYLVRNQEKDAFRFLKKAVQRQGRWLSKARKNSILQQSSQITEYLSSAALNPAQATTA